MKIKLYTCNVKANISDDLQKVTEYFNSHHIPVSFEQENTTVKLPEANIKQKLVSPNDGKYDVVIYMYDRLEQRPDGHGLAENYSKKTSVIYLPTGVLEDVDGFHFYATAHEIMHFLFHRLLNQGIYLSDPFIMDTYIENTNPYSTTGNFAQAWKLLAPYMSLLGATSPIQPSFTLTRLSDNGRQTLGQLRADDGSFGCDTLELSYQGNLKNISAIPKGTYTCKWSFMFKDLAYHYLLMNIPNRTGIFIHAGNFFFNTEGCILLGSAPKDINGDKQIDLQNSRLILSAFEKKVQGKDFTLKIK